MIARMHAQSEENRSSNAGGSSQIPPELSLPNEGRVAPAPSLEAGPRICIIAMKSLVYNTRVRRQAKSLKEAGFDVTVISITPPGEMKYPAGEGVRHIPITLHLRLIGFLGTIFRFGELQPPQERSLTLAERPRQSVWQRVPLYVFHLLLFPLRLMSAGAVYTLLRLQTPPGYALRADHGDVLAARTGKLLRALIRPYAAELRRRVFTDEVWKRLRDEKFDLVQAHDSYALEISTRLSRANGAGLLYDAVEIFAHRSDNAVKGTFPAVYRRLMARDVRLLRDADTVITVSRGVGEWMKQNYGIEPPLIIRNCQMPWDRKADDRLRAKINADSLDRIVIFVNTVHPGRGVETLIEALTHLPTHIRAVTQGHEAVHGYIDQCIQYARLLGVENRINFLPVLPNADLIPFISGADVGVIPFRTTPINNLYSLPNRLFEMVQARLPIVVANLPCMQQIVEEYGIGLVYEPDNAKSLAEAIARILDGAAYPDYVKFVDRAAAELSWPKEAECYLEAVWHTLRRVRADRADAKLTFETASRLNGSSRHSQPRN